MDHLSAATVAPTGSLNIMVIEPPIFVKGPLSNLTSFRLRRPFRSRLAKGVRFVGHDVCEPFQLDQAA